MGKPLVFWEEGNSCCNPKWEAAYRRFESEAQEIRKFRSRLEALGAAEWNRDSRIVDLFCGTGKNLQCLENLGFQDLHGVDLSPRLLQQYRGNAQVYVGDATSLRFPDSWADIVIVQGGLHHLPSLPENLNKCLSEIRRILKPGGLFVFVEPWTTPFLVVVHWCCGQKSLRTLSPKLAALSEMIAEEKTTYDSWLNNPGAILESVDSFFSKKTLSMNLGKIFYTGRKPG
jgi:SAM-dependent methyltransferase